MMSRGNGSFSVPLHASSIGKLLLSTFDEARLEKFLADGLQTYTSATITDADDLREELARIRRRGWSSAVDELEDGLSALSVGVSGMALAASPSGRIVLHVVCAWRDHRFQWHWRGVVRVRDARAVGGVGNVLTVRAGIPYFRQPPLRQRHPFHGEVHVRPRSFQISANGRSSNFSHSS